MSKENLKETYSEIALNNELIKLNTELEINSPYFFGYNILGKLTFKLNDYKFDKLFLITDPTVYNLYGRELLNQLKANFHCDPIIVSEGEVYKNISTLNTLCEDIVRKGVSKDSILLALGGGVVGNIVGLAAALIYRGIRFVELPTTTLAQTDSTLSNKQAINSPTGKNHFGVCHAPIFIWADVKLLLSESPRRIKSGLVESVKNGLIADPQFLNYLEGKLNNGTMYAENDLKELILKSIQSKINILKKDSTEKKYGIILEYGHTFGHAIEKLSQGLLTHGEAIAIGMTIAAETSHRLGYLNYNGVKRHHYFLNEKMDLDLKLPFNIRVDDIIRVIKSDNKRSSKGVKYVLLEDIGKVLNSDGDYMVSVDNKIARDILEEFTID